MREVSPGDIVFSFVDTRIAAIGIARSYCWESLEPAEFGEIGQNWENVGWKVNVRFTILLNKVRPKGQQAAKPAQAKKTATPRAHNKGSNILALIGRPKGATLTEIMAVAEWQAHSVRGFLSTASKKRGLKIKSTETESRERTCRIAKKTRLASRRHLRGWWLYCGHAVRPCIDNKAHGQCSDIW